MSDKEQVEDLGERIRRIAATFTGQADKRSAAGDELPSMLDAAARSLGTTIERWGRNPGLRRILGGVQRDELTSPGDSVELSASLGVSGKLGTVARFYVDDAVAAETPIGDSTEIRALIEAPGPGLHRVSVAVCNDKGQVVTDLFGHRLLQVASGRPVVLVDAALLLPRRADQPVSAASPIDALRALVDEGFELVYFDIHEKNRDPLIREALVEQRLPPGAILVYSAEEEELRSLGVDFVDMFASTAIRRLRAKGVPVTTILTEREQDSDADFAEQVSVMTPATARSRALAGAFATEIEQAAKLLRDRASSNPLDWRLDQTTKSKLVPGNCFHAELDNREARLRLLAAFEEAQSTIHIQFYMVQPSDF
ncbi:MAG: hypothetical protein WCB63_14675, partial [Polyangiales bacterium]